MILRRLFIWSVLLVAALYFLLPLMMTLVFGLWQGRDSYGLANFTALAGRAEVWDALVLTLELCLATGLAVFALVVPATLAIHLYLPRARGVIEFFAALPFVVPAISLVAGLTAVVSGPGWLVGSPFYLVIFYVLQVLPYTVRSIDIGLTRLNGAVLREAAESLGAGAVRTLVFVIMPNLGGVLLNALMLIAIIVTGEFTVANLLLFRTFPVAIFELGRAAPMQAAALSFLVFLASWLVMLAVFRMVHRKAAA